MKKLLTLCVCACKRNTNKLKYCRALFCAYFSYNKVYQHHRAKYNSVPAEEFEIVLFNVTHKEFNDYPRNRKGDSHTEYQIEKLCGRVVKAVFDEL